MVFLFFPTYILPSKFFLSFLHFNFGLFSKKNFTCFHFDINFRELVGMGYSRYPVESPIVPDGLFAHVPPQKDDLDRSDEFMSVEDF